MKKLLALLLCFGLAFTTVATVQALEDDNTTVETGDEGENNPGEPSNGDEGNGEGETTEDEYGIMLLGKLCPYDDCW